MAQDDKTKFAALSIKSKLGGGLTPEEEEELRLMKNKKKQQDRVKMINGDNK